MVKLSKHLVNSFELQIWFITTGLAGLRGIVGVVDDLVANPIHWDELAVDSIITALFITICYRIFAGLVSQIPVWISLIFIILLCINYIQFGGVGNGVEFNLMGLGILLILANKASSLRLVMILYFSIILLVLLENHYLGWLSSILLIELQNSQLDFLLMLVTLSLIILYFKLILLKESTKLMDARAELTARRDLIRLQNKKLSEQKKYIDSANQRLQDEFVNQTSYLVENNESIEKFAQHVTETMIAPLERAMEHTRAIQSDNPLEKMTKSSIHDLNNVVHKLKRQLTDHEQ